MLCLFHVVILFISSLVRIDPFCNLDNTTVQLYSTVNASANNVQIRHSNVPLPTTMPDDHSPTGEFMFFRQYDVEKRSRVKLITADEGIPLSTQWDPRGYTYPIQIAQFGLSHYSKLFHARQQHETSTLDPLAHDFDILVQPNEAAHWPGRHTWNAVKSGSKLFRFEVSSAESPPIGFTHNMLAFTSSLTRNHANAIRWRYFLLSGSAWHRGSAVRLRLAWCPNEVCLTPDFKYFIYACDHSPTDDVHRLPTRHFTISPDQSTVTFWMPGCVTANQTEARVELARDLHSDMLKTLQPIKQSHDPMTQDGLAGDTHPIQAHIMVDSLDLIAGSDGPNGGGLVRQMRLASAPLSTHTGELFHESRFLAGANWLLRNQNKKDGAWHVHVPRRIRGRNTIRAGWSSAMAQGHAISLLVRAFHHTGDESYLTGAYRAIQPFEHDVGNKSGVRSHFLGQASLPWFEEYPSQPPMHVLNGFVYSLIGLYDLSQIPSSSSIEREKSRQLWLSGLKSLEALLPLFDSGSGSFYDLRHVMPHIPASLAHNNQMAVNESVQLGPNRARPSYHALHIRQLRLLSRIDSTHANIWSTTATRWSAYLTGARSPHN